MGIESTGDDAFGARLRQLREARGLSQGDLAALVNVQPGHISHFEHGRRSPSLLTLKKLADTLQTSMDYLTGRVDDPNLQHQPDFGNSVVAQINRTVKDLPPADQYTAQIMVEALKNKPQGPL